MRRALVDIGPAVFNGGFSTYLAFALLCFSNSYLFRSFFKVNIVLFFPAQKLNKSLLFVMFFMSICKLSHM